MNNNSNRNENIFLIDLQLLATFVFIISSIISYLLTYNEKRNLTGNRRIFTTKQTLDIAYYNRIAILVVVLISLYVGYKNYQVQENDTRGKFKSGLLLSTNILTLISAVIILYVSYLNREDQSLNITDVENPLI